MFGEKRGRLVFVKDNRETLYRDVLATAWYAPYVANLIEEGIAEGYKDAAGRLTGKFGVEEPVTYAEILKMALEAAGKDVSKAGSPRNLSAKGSWASAYVSVAEDMKLRVFSPGLDVHKPATRAEVIQTILEVKGIPIGSQKAEYRDVPASHPYSPAIAVATFCGLVQGDDQQDTFRPDADIIRAEVAKIIALAAKLLK